MPDRPSWHPTRKYRAPEPWEPIDPFVYEAHLKRDGPMEELLTQSLTKERGYNDALTGRPCEPEYTMIDGVPRHRKGYVDYRGGYLAGLQARASAERRGKQGPDMISGAAEEASSRQSLWFTLILLVWSGVWIWSAVSHHSTLFWALPVLGALAFLIAVEMDRQKPWWVAIPKALVGEVIGFVLGFVFLVGLFVVQVVMRGVFALGVSALLIALAIALAVNACRFLYRQWRARVRGSRSGGT